jgi:hypothetical protein
MTQVELYAIGKSTTLESNKSLLGLKFRDTVLIPGHPQRAVRGMHGRIGFVVQLFLALAYEHPHNWHGCVLLLERLPRSRLHVLPGARRSPSPGERAHPLRALRRGGNGVRWRRGEVEELVRERHDERVDDRLQRHEGGGPPLLIHDGDMPVRAAQHLV